MRAVFENLFDCTEGGFWDLYMDLEFHRTFWVDGTGASEFVVLLDETDPSAVRRRRFRVGLTGLELPGPLQRAVGGPISFTEEGRYDPARKEYTYSQRYSILSDRIGVSGRITARPQGGSRVLRVAEVDISVRLLGLGRLAEKATASNLEWGFDTEAKTAARWLKERATRG